jgi:hypothetical protein
MSTEYTLTEREYVSAALLNGEIRGKSRIIHRVLDSALIICALILISLQEYVLAIAVFCAFVFANVLPFLLQRLLVPWQLKRHYQKYPSIQKPVSCAVSTSGIDFKSENSEGCIPWPEIHKWRSGRGLVLVYPAPKLYYAIPMEVAEKERLVPALAENVGNAT